MRPPERRSLWDLAACAGLAADRFIADASGRISLAELRSGTCIGRDLEALRGATVLISCDRQLPAALVLLQLDGIARRMLLCPPDLAAEHLPAVIAEGQVDLVLSDGTGPAARLREGLPVVACYDGCQFRAEPATDRREETEWVLFTSGTTGPPKLVPHLLSSLTGPLENGPVAVSDAVWSTFYDIRRYGGLQILLRALLGGGSLVLSQAGEPVQDFLVRAGEAGVTHMLGTPSHWRRALMSRGAGHLAPRYVRLSGEVADQAILNQLAQAYPSASLTHAYASTEAGVGFEVNDGLEGFPARVIDEPRGSVEIRVVDGSLRVRSPRTASRYLGDRGTLADASGFIDTGDMVALRGDRYYFAGRREGIINVGGQKVHPEEVEAVINRHPDVQMAQVRGRSSPIIGAIVVADIVVRRAGGGAVSFAVLKDEILATCREVLPAHKVPAMLREVPSLDVTGSGKLARARA